MKNLNMKQKKTVLTVMMAISFALLLLANFLHGLGRTVAWILLIVSLSGTMTSCRLFGTPRSIHSRSPTESSNTFQSI